MKITRAAAVEIYKPACLVPTNMLWHRETVRSHFFIIRLMWVKLGLLFIILAVKKVKKK